MNANPCLQKSTGSFKSDFELSGVCRDFPEKLQKLCLKRGGLSELQVSLQEYRSTQFDLLMRAGGWLPGIKIT